MWRLAWRSGSLARHREPELSDGRQRLLLAVLGAERNFSILQKPALGSMAAGVRQGWEVDAPWRID